MKKLILPIILSLFTLLVFSSGVYAQPEKITSSAKPSSGYNPYCWQTHMIDQMAVCSKAHGSCIKQCPMQDLKANALCLTECSNILTVCYKKASADYKICIEAEKQAESKATQAPSKKPEIQDKSSKSTQSNQAQPEGKENLVIKALGGFPVFIGDWFSAVSTGWGMQEFFYQNELFADEVLFGRDRREIAEEEAAEQEKDNLQFQQNRKEILDKQGLADLDEVFNRIPIIKDAPPSYKTGEWQQDSPFRLDVLEGQVQIKYPGESAWRDIKVGDKIPEGSTIFTGMDTTTVLSIKDKGVVQILPFTEITISEEGLSEPGKTTTEINLRTGEVELNLPSGIFTGSLQVFTTNAVAGVRGTHFWVSYNKEKNLSMVGVYEGTVEVKVLGSDKTTLVSPNGDPSTGLGEGKPGVVVVNQKLSPLRLTIASLVLVVIIGGAVLILKKKFSAKGSNKKKR